MMAVNLKEIVLQELKNNNIKINDIAMMESLQMIAEGTFLPKLYSKIKMLDGSIRNLSFNLSSEMIQDLHAHGVEVEGDIEDLNKYFKRKISLNELLGYE